MHYDLIGLGVATWDIIGVVARGPEFGIKQELAELVEMGGGPVATALVAFARLGGRGALISAVGADGYGIRIRDDLQQAGVDVSAVAVRSGCSHVAFVLAEPGNDRRTVFWHNDPEVFTATPLDRTAVTAGRALLIDTHMPEQAQVAARWMRDAGGIVMIDAERIRPGTLELLPLCDWIVVSARFGREAGGQEHPAAAARALQERYAGNVVVTCGAEGSWCATAAETWHTPAFMVTPVDTTGSGDVFHGALLYALLRGDGPKAGLRFATAAAALKCGGLGGRGALPTLAEVEALVNT
ncbi:MAG: sugar kinase [Oscillochloris sp.]|nr:sugar kinase [Oscillochloris sp.]